MRFNAGKFDSLAVPQAQGDVAPGLVGELVEQLPPHELVHGRPHLTTKK
jgi:hypothetical protein